MAWMVSASSPKISAMSLTALLAFPIGPLPGLGQDFFPAVDGGQIKLHVRARTGSRIDTTTRLADAVEAAVARQLALLPRKEIAGASWRDYGAIIEVGKLDDAVPLVDRLAPEHLEIIAADAEALAGKIRNAGAIFLGAHTPEAIGDYVAGSNHVLPTARSARFSSGLSVLDFMKRTTLVACDPRALAAIGPAAVTLARAEGLEAHARSVAQRLGPAAEGPS